MLEQAVRRSSLTVSTTASFAAAWLVPRLGRFSERHPATEIQILTGDELTHIGPSGVELAQHRARFRASVAVP